MDLTGLGIAGPIWIDDFLSLEDAHDQLRECVTRQLQTSTIPFIIGGGNDQSWPNCEALLNMNKLQARGDFRLGVINIDAHFDVRPLKDGKLHSGAPFRKLLESVRKHTWII